MTNEVAGEDPEIARTIAVKARAKYRQEYDLLAGRTRSFIAGRTEFTASLHRRSLGTRRFVFYTFHVVVFPKAQSLFSVYAIQD